MTVGALMAVCAVLIGLLVARTRTAATSVVQPTSSPKVTAAVLDVASRFNCACGQCEGESLDRCDCTHVRGAAEVKQAIAAQLDAGRTYLETVQAIQARYGSLKPQYLSLLSTGPSADDENVTKDTPRAVLADFSQRDAILRHFQCPCGKCGENNVADCDCDHPGGAKDVKNFLDRKIFEQKYTADQLVALVEQQYGHRIDK